MSVDSSQGDEAQEGHEDSQEDSDSNEPDPLEVAQAAAKKWEKRAQNDARKLRAAQAALQDKSKADDADKTHLDEKVAVAELDALRYKVALEHRLPADLAVRLLGDTRDEIEEDAAKLEAMLPKSRPPAPGRGQGKPPGKPPADPNELLRAMARG